VSSGVRVPALAAPPKLRHLRSGTRAYPHRSLPVKPPVARAPAARMSTRRSSRVRTTAPTTPQARASSEPKPIPAPTHKIAVQVVQPISPPSTATPADATPPASDPSAPPGQATTTST
jgi:hypothetical protein